MRRCCPQALLTLQGSFVLREASRSTGFCAIWDCISSSSSSSARSSTGREVSMEKRAVDSGVVMSVIGGIGSIVDTGNGSGVGAGGCVGVGINVSKGIRSGDDNGDGCSVD